MGEEVARRAQVRLAGYARSAYAAMIVKERAGEGWVPVGEEDFYAVVRKDRAFTQLLPYDASRTSNSLESMSTADHTYICTPLTDSFASSTATHLLYPPPFQTAPVSSAHPQRLSYTFPTKP
jgi:hypothetical protein